jgi:hypothetical protein
VIGETDRAARLRARPWAEIIYLLTLTLTRDPYSAPATVTLRLSDRAYRYPEAPPDASAIMLAPTEQWEPFVRSWGGIGDAIDPHNGGVSVAALDVVLDNSRPIAGVTRFSDLIRTTRNPTGYDFPFSPAELRQVFKGTEELDRYRLFRLVIEELTDVSDETCTLKMSGIELVLEDYDILPRISTDRFPFAAPEAVGQAVPLLLGRIRNAPVLMAIAGQVDKLKESITASFPATGQNLELSTPDLVARLPTAGTVQLKIGSTQSLTTTTTSDLISTATDQAAQANSLVECIGYLATDPSTARLLNITRGARSTQPGTAAAGADVYQLLPEYVGIVGVNLGPLAAQELTAVYCDGMAKKPETQPVHTIEMANTTFWPPHSLTLVRFDTGEVAAVEPDTVVIAADEIKEIPTMTDNCYLEGCISGDGSEFSWGGNPIVRVGQDHPCGSPLQFFQVYIRWNIATLPANPNLVRVRLWRGGGDQATGDIGAWTVPDWTGTIGGAGTQSARGKPCHGTDIANQPRDDIGIVLRSGLFQGQYFYFPVTDQYLEAKTANHTSFVIGLGLVSTPVNEYQDVWYGIGAGGTAAPLLYLSESITGASPGSGALLTRPNAGTAARSAAEASLGFVTVDVTGPIETVQVPPPLSGLFGFVDGFESSDLSHWSYVSGVATIGTNVRGGGVTGKYCLEAGDSSIQRGWGNVLGAPQRLRIYACVRSWSFIAGGALHHHVATVATGGGVYPQHAFGLDTYSLGGVAHKRFFASIAGTTFSYTADYDWQIGVWYRFEARMEGLTIGQPGTVTVNVYLGDTMTLVGTVSATGTLAGDPPSHLIIGPYIVGGGVTITMAFDDLVLSSIDDGEIGPGGVWLAVPSADVEPNMTPNTGTTNYSRVDDWPGPVDDDGSYVSATSSGMLDRYRIRFPSGAPAASKRLRHSNLMLRVNTVGVPAVETYGVVWTHAGAKYTGGVTYPSSWTWVVNGGPSALMRWADVDAVTASNFTIGVERAAGSATLRVSAVAWNLDFH